jgi:hypothetical protein
MVRVPGLVPGDAVPALVTVPVIVPEPLSVPTSMLSGAESTPPTVVVPPFWLMVRFDISVPLGISRFPAPLHSTFVRFAIPLPTLRTIPSFVSTGRDGLPTQLA